MWLQSTVFYNGSNSWFDKNGVLFQVVYYRGGTELGWKGKSKG